MPGVDSLKHAVANGLGIGIVPRAAVSSLTAPAGLVVIPLPAARAASALHARLSRQRRTTNCCRGLRRGPAEHGRGPRLAKSPNRHEGRRGEPLLRSRRRHHASDRGHHRRRPERCGRTLGRPRRARGVSSAAALLVPRAPRRGRSRRPRADRARGAAWRPRRHLERQPRGVDDHAIRGGKSRRRPREHQSSLPPARAGICADPFGCERAHCRPGVPLDGLCGHAAGAHAGTDGDADGANPGGTVAGTSPCHLPRHRRATGWDRLGRFSGPRQSNRRARARGA